MLARSVHRHQITSRLPKQAHTIPESDVPRRLEFRVWLTEEPSELKLALVLWLRARALLTGGVANVNFERGTAARPEVGHL
jgi:hypothetical protein